jgi:ribonucleoside-diphosphate reductase beta chain
MQEPLLESNPQRFVLFPIRHDDIWRKCKQQQASMWTAEEIDLSKDKSDWNSLTDDERHFLKYVLAFFSSSDGIVLENLLTRFYQDVEIPEVRYFYSFQSAIEQVHSETYSLLIDTYIDNPEEKLSIFHAVDTFPAINAKAAWALKWIADTNAPFSQRLVAFAIVEGVFFSGSFCSIFWLKTRALLPGLTFSNELISRDEGLHTDFACLLYSKIKNRLPTETIHSMFQEAVSVETDFITSSLPCKLIGMNSDLMTQYIQFVADHLLNELDYPLLWNVKNPFEFMNMISLRGKTNFFEKRVGDYSLAGVVTGTETNLDLVDDF